MPEHLNLYLLEALSSLVCDNLKLQRGYISSSDYVGGDAAGCSRFAPSENNSLRFCWKEKAIMDWKPRVLHVFLIYIYHK